MFAFRDVCIYFGNKRGVFCAVAPILIILIQGVYLRTPIKSNCVEKKVKKPYNAFLKGVITRKRCYNAKWKGGITPFMHKKA